jgi:hypothetical protein
VAATRDRLGRLRAPKQCMRYPTKLRPRASVRRSVPVQATGVRSRPAMPRDRAAALSCRRVAPAARLRKASARGDEPSATPKPRPGGGRKARQALLACLRLEACRLKHSAQWIHTPDASSRALQRPREPPRRGGGDRHGRERRRTTPFRPNWAHRPSLCLGRSVTECMDVLTSRQSPRASVCRLPKPWPASKSSMRGAAAQLTESSEGCSV